MRSDATIRSPASVVTPDDLRDLGIVLVSCDADGRLRMPPARGAHALLDLCCHCPMLTSALHRAGAAWSAEANDRTTELLPGVWARSWAGHQGGRLVALVLTRELIESEHLLALCQSARLDATLVHDMLARMPLCPDPELPRQFVLLDHVVAALREAPELSAAMESMGSELAASYEEINLLYSTIDSMSVIEEPHRFVSLACERLLQTLSYQWIGVIFNEQHPWLGSLAGELVVAGDPDPDEPTLRRLCRPLLDRCADGDVVVIEPDDCEPDRPFRPLGRELIAEPISRNRQLLGVMVAANKREEGGATSFDIKLLGATATHLAIFLENAALYEDLNATFMGTLEGLTAAIDAKDRYTCGHSLRVAHVTRQLALEVGIDDATAERMHIAGLVHDVGKIGVPESVLTKPGRLTQDEFALVQKHPEIGFRILKDIPQLRDILPGVLHHHERWDGKGYPAGLAGDAIPRIARIIALADAFDAMSSNRSYRSSMDRETVLQEIRDQSGRQFDPELAPIFVELDFGAFDRLVESHAKDEL